MRLRSSIQTSRTRWAGLTSAALLLSGFVTVAAASAGTPAFAAAPSFTVTPSAYVGGQLLHWSGNVGHRGVRSFVLQRNMGRSGDRWTTVEGFKSHTRADGGFDFFYPAPSMFNIRYRVKAGKYYSPPRSFDAKTQDLTIRVTGQPETKTNDAARVKPQRPFGITVDTAPDNIARTPSTRGLPVLPGRTLTLQRRVDGDTWETVTTTTVDARGLGAFSGLSEPAGVSVYRVREEDFLAGGNQIGWTQSFPLHVYAGAESWSQHLREQRAAEAAPSRAPEPSSVRMTAPTATAGGRYHWHPVRWGFAWEAGESLTSGPKSGSRPGGWWLDYSDGSGRVSKHNGGLALDSKRFNGPGPGDFGTTRATLRGNSAKQGRWEARMRVRGAYESGAGDYRIVAELVPARASDYDCGSHNIEIASISPFSNRVRFGVRSPEHEWRGSTTAGTTPVHSAYAVGVELSKKHTTWFLDGVPVGSVSDPAAFAGVPMTLRFSLEGDGQSEMNAVSLISDWQRAFPISTGHPTTSKKRLSRTSVSGC